MPFTIAAGIAIVFALLQASGLLGLLAGDHEADGGHEADHDVDADAHDADHDGGDDADHDAETSGGVRDFLAGSLGFGRLPFSLIWQTYAVVFAATGLAINTRVFWGRAPTTISLVWTVPIGLFAGYAVVAMMARFLGPIFASKAQQATSRAELVGQMGVVISSKVTAEFGEVRIRDKTGHDLRVICKLADGAKAPLEHQRVVVVDYAEERGELLVAPLEDEEEDREIGHKM